MCVHNIFLIFFITILFKLNTLLEYQEIFFNQSSNFLVSNFHSAMEFTTSLSTYTISKFSNTIIDYILVTLLRFFIIV